MIEKMLEKIFKKVGTDLHIFLNGIVLLFCAFLVVILAVVAFKYEKLKIAMYYYAGQAAVASKQQYVGAGATEDAEMFATTIASVPVSNPLFTDQKNLQALVALLSRQTGRNIVVEDVHQKILAATITGNIGATYTYGNGLDEQTLKDGMPRRFTEKSKDYPAGEDQVVVPVRNNVGVITGAVIMSTSHVFDN